MVIRETISIIPGREGTCVIAAAGGAVCHSVGAGTSIGFLIDYIFAYDICNYKECEARGVTDYCGRCK